MSRKLGPLLSSVPDDQKTLDELTKPGGTLSWGVYALFVIATLATALAFFLGSISNEPEPMSPGEASAAVRAAHPELFKNDLGLTEIKEHGNRVASPPSPSSRDPKGSVNLLSQKASVPGRAKGSLQARAMTNRDVWHPIVFSVYSDYFDGRKAADGSRFSQNGFTVASNTHKLGTVLELVLVNAEDAPPIRVTVTDRTAKRFTGQRIDLSKTVWNLLTINKAPGLVNGKWRVAK